MIDPETIQDYIDGELDETKARELSQWLLAAPANRALFRREVVLAATLTEQAAATAQQPASTSSARTHETKRRSKKIRHQRPLRPRMAPRLFAVGAIAAVVVLSAILVLRQPPAPLALPAYDLVISDFRGSVSVVRGDSPMTKLPTTLQPGDHVRIGSNATALLEMDHGRTRIWAASDTTLVIATIREARERAGTRLEVARGSLTIEAAPQPADAPLRIGSARSEAEVVGTVLSFSALPDRDRLLVGHGVVAYALRRNGQRAQLAAGGLGESDGTHLTIGRLDYQPPLAITKARVTGFSLIDDSTGKPIPGYAQLESGCVIDLKALHGRKINLSAEVAWPPANEHGHVVFHYDDTKPIAEAAAPYTLLSDLPPFADLLPAVRFPEGVHALVATPYSGDISKHRPSERPVGGAGDPGSSATLIFTVINATP